MRTSDIRTTFLDYFTSRGHVRVDSMPLIPREPTLLLTNAGMNAFIPIFRGEVEPEHRRVTSLQKCARTSDLVEVGVTARHVTFFEMLGNFAFGDYFKEETIAFAWELMTEHFSLDVDRLWITVYRDDDEAETLWRRIGVRPDRIQRLGMAENYWSMGVPGPCGPSSEICYDRGPAYGPDGGPAVNEERYLELWNLVFMRNLRGPNLGGSEGAKEDYEIVGELPSWNIDTGLGLDRLAMILQEVESIARVDMLAPTLSTVEELTGRPFPGHGTGPDSVSYQVITDHARTIAFLLADGVLPSNDGRGHVLRRLMRRAIRHARRLGIDGEVLPTVTRSVVDTLGEWWPELVEGADTIETVTSREEMGFDATLRHGGRLLAAAIDREKTGRSSELTGEAAFELHDTYGFPIDLTVEIATEAGLTVDRDRFGELLDEQRKRAREAAKKDQSDRPAAYRELVERHGRPEFLGYEAERVETSILAILRDGSIVDSSVVDEREPGQRVEVVLARTPFYARSGGQVGDTGVIRTADGGEIEIIDTRNGVDGLSVHTGIVRVGGIRPGERVEAVIDADRRAAVARSHSTTHVVHAMLRRVLGTHVRQRGSEVSPDRVRFDFSHFSGLDRTQLTVIEGLVNDYLLDDPDVRVWHASRAEAERAGALAFFGDKYGERVRVVDIGDESRELCVGTHIGHGSQAGPVRFVGEESVAAGVRRIEALTGRDALRYADHDRRLVSELTALVEVSPDRLVETLTARLRVAAEAERSLRLLRRRELAELADQLLGGRRTTGNGWLVSARLDQCEAGELRTVVDRIRAKAGSGERGIVLLATASGGKAQLIAWRADPDLGSMRELLSEAGRIVGGGAGGTAELANAGGRLVDRLDVAFATAERTAAELL